MPSGQFFTGRGSLDMLQGDFRQSLHPLSPLFMFIALNLAASLLNQSLDLKKHLAPKARPRDEDEVVCFPD